MLYMDRTTIMLPSNFRDSALALARREDISLAELIRRALVDVIERKKVNYKADDDIYTLMSDWLWNCF